MDFVLSDALGLGGFDAGNTVNAYDQLSDLCTALVIAEEGAFVPLEPVGNMLLACLKSAPTSGDVHVMAARALALVLDKFSFSFKLFKKKSVQSVTECLQHVFSLVAAHTATLTFEKTTRTELVEEILRCLTHGCSSALPVVQKMMPPTDVQLAFCESAIDGSKWASCKVLQHCSLLTRRGLESDENKARVVGLLRCHLKLLAQLDMDYEWDELLRTVVEGIVMVRVWTRVDKEEPLGRGRLSSSALCRSSAEEGSRTGKKNSRSGATSHATAPPSKSLHESVAVLMLALCERVCASHTAVSRKELLLACVALTLTATELNSDAPLAQRQRVLSSVLTLVGDDTDGVLEFSNPFLSKRTVTSDQDEPDDAFKALANLQWVVPTLPWSALLLISKLVGSEPPVRGAYVWAWRGEGDVYYWYRRRERQVMTESLFSGRRTATLKSGSHEADLVRLLDRNVRTDMTTRIHFQPIPCAVSYDGVRLRQTESVSVATLLAVSNDAALASSLLRSLRALSFGHTALAVFAKAVHLYVVCAVGPGVMADEAEVALRAYAVDHDAASVESLAFDLLQRSADWGPILLAAGVPDSIENSLPPASTPRQGASGGRVRGRKRSRALSPSPTLAGLRRSPVATLIRGASSTTHGTLPAVRPLQLPSHTNLSELLQHGSTSELIEMLVALAGEDTTSGWPRVTADEADAAAQLVQRIAPSSACGQKLSAAVSMYTLRALSSLSVAGRHALPLLARLEQHARPSSLTICSPRHSRAVHGEPGAQASSSQDCGQCPQGHDLRVHFSTNWLCDECHTSTAFGAWSCRACNYDLCYRCAARVLHRIDVNCTACVGDVARAWSARAAPHSVDSATGLERPEGGHQSYLSCLYTGTAVLSAAAPSGCLFGRHEPVHMGPIIGSCACGVSCPEFVLTVEAVTDGAERGRASDSVAKRPLPLWWAVVRRFGGAVAREPTTSRAVVEVLGMYASDIFLSGVNGLPGVVRHLLVALRDGFPLDVKRRVAHFLTIGCRRFALQHIQDTGDVPLRGSAVGEVESNGLAFRLNVSRAGATDGDLLAELHAGFSQQIPLRNKVEFRFKNEEGTGSGPTQELYSELSMLFAEHTEFWCQGDEGARIPFPNCTHLYVREWFVLGAACARAFIDDYQFRVGLLPLAWRVICDTPGRDGSPPQSPNELLWDLFAVLQPTMARSFEKLRSEIHSDEELLALGLDDEDGRPLTLATRDAYIASQVHSYLAVGLQNLRGFAMGLLTSLDLDAFFLLTHEDMSQVVCGPVGAADAPLFTEDDLRSVTLGAHGYSTGCKEVEMFITTVGGFDRAHQAFFLEFLTGSAYLPPTGLKGLKSKITVVRKDMDGEGEQTLPSCNTCFLYLKLPPYSSSEIMARRLLVAIVEGRKNFSLS